MTEGRRLAYDFLNLPHHTQRAILERLGLLFKKESGRDDIKLFVKCFERARKRKKIDALRVEVSREMAE